MLLAIDIGNTNIKMGLWNGRSWQNQWRLRTAHEKTADEYGIALNVLLQQSNETGPISGAVIASVVPFLTNTFAQVCETQLQITPLQVSHQLDLGIEMLVDTPAAVGADRVVNVVAAHRLYPGPAIVIDMGTATKFEVVSTNGRFHGGVIAPGLRITADALTNRAAKLSQVALTGPATIIGKNTIHAVQAGLIFGYVSLIEGIVARLRHEHPDQSAPAQIIATGGLISLIAPHTEIVDVIDPLLTLNGCRLLYKRVPG